MVISRHQIEVFAVTAWTDIITSNHLLSSSTLNFIAYIYVVFVVNEAELCYHSRYLEISLVRALYCAPARDFANLQVK